MSIELSEDLIPVREASSHIPTDPHLSTVHRWMMHGVGVGCKRVYLESIVIGGRRYTSIQAIQRFVLKRSEMPDCPWNPHQAELAIQKATTLEMNPVFGDQSGQSLRRNSSTSPVGNHKSSGESLVAKKRGAQK